MLKISLRLNVPRALLIVIFNTKIFLLSVKLKMKIYIKHYDRATWVLKNNYLQVCVENMINYKMLKSEDFSVHDLCWKNDLF